MAFKTPSLRERAERRASNLAELATPFVVTLSIAAAASLPACWGNPGGDDGFASDSDTGSTTADTTTTTTDGTTTEGTGSASASSTATTASTTADPTTTTASTCASSTTIETTEGTTDPSTGTTAEPTTGTTDPTTGTTGGGGIGFDPLDDGVQMCSDDFAMDPVEIVSAGIKGDLLVLQISYSGGCSDHEFGLCWDGAFAESDPVQTWITLGHESNDDPCDGIVMEEKFFDLGAMKQAWIDGYQQMNGTIIIHLSGWKDPIPYMF